jgi:hypothetical protein
MRANRDYYPRTAMPARPTWLPASLLLFLGACTEPAPPAAAFSDLPIDLTSAFCDWQARCCTGAEIADASHGRYASADQCRAAGLELDVRDQLGLVAASIDEGRVTVNADRAEACIAEYRNRSCNGAGGPMTPTTAPDLSVLLACPGAFVGHTPLGRRCDTPVDCVAGGHCHIYPVGGGICVADRAQGDPCDVDGDCGPGLACRTTDFTCDTAPAGGTSATDGGTPDGGTPPVCMGA